MLMLAMIAIRDASSYVIIVKTVCHPKGVNS